MTKKNLIFIHGFASSSKARKAEIIKKYLQKHSELNIEFNSLDFPDTPKEAFESIKNQIKSFQDAGDCIGVIGASMGGFFAMHLTQQLQFKACLVNPCIDPWNLLPQFLGTFKNYYTGKEFTLDESSIQDVKNIKALPIDFAKLFVFLETADEVLDYKVAKKFFDSHYETTKYIMKGGHHTFDYIEDFLPIMIKNLFE